MKKDPIVIGAQTLESLTTGMYTDPFIMYREYIQNSVDAIDDALNKDIIEKSKTYISIQVDPENFNISIEDNGSGINSNKAAKILTDIGNSQKDFKKSRGFRGIGRLGGISYADKLIFTTSSKGDDKKTIVSWDCQALKKLLSPWKCQDYNLEKMINHVVTIKYLPEKSAKHYFKVELTNIGAQFRCLLKEDLVERYISKIAPVPFDSREFKYGTEIHDRIKRRGKALDEYNIYINNSSEPIYKKFRKTFETGNRTEIKKDKISKLVFFDCFDENEDLMYLGWYADHNFFGQIRDEHMQGIRIRKGNMLIGDEATFSQYFREKVANTWFIGELYIFNENIFPNARRDNFEHAPAAVTSKNSNALAEGTCKQGRRYTFLSAIQPSFTSYPRFSWLFCA